MKPLRFNTQSGLTMVELLVSLVLTSLITLAATALYSVSLSSYRTVDASQELQDSGRFALEVIGQAARIAGYQNFAQRSGNGSYNTRNLVSSTFPTVHGANNAKVASSTNDGVNNNGGYNLSDTVAFRFHGSSLLNDAITPDGSIIDCLGIAQNYPSNADDVGLSLFWIKVDSSGEPALECISRGDPTSSSLTRKSEPIVKGVESFQVMYGLVGDTATITTPVQWVSAQDVGSDVADWAKVSAVRVGLIIRGEVGSLQSRSDTASEQKLYPLGKDFTGANNTEAGLVFSVPNDGRLRRVFNATYKLRNSQN